nr:MULTISPECIES: hypothetical protein [Myxococcaceae]
MRARGWREEERGRWTSEVFGPHPLAKALHHQLTDDLSQALRERGWQVLGFSERGYVQLREGERGRPCSLPKALRTQARREGRPVAELTYALFLAALVGPEEGGPG